MQERNDINMDCDHEKYCVSWFTTRVTSIGTNLAVHAWNDHPIPGIDNHHCSVLVSTDYIDYRPPTRNSECADAKEQSNCTHRSQSAS